MVLLSSCRGGGEPENEAKQECQVNKALLQVSFDRLTWIRYELINFCVGMPWLKCLLALVLAGYLVTYVVIAQ